MLNPLPQRVNQRRQCQQNTSSTTSSNHSNTSSYFTYVIIGGGIAGTEAAKTLVALSQSSPSNTVALITPHRLSDTLDTIHLTPHLQLFNIILTPMTEFVDKYPQCTIIPEYVVSLNQQEKYVVLSSGKHVSYGRLCIASGAVPRQHCINHPLVIGIRDIDSTVILEQAVHKKSQRICVVGNGAIALEAVGFLLQQDKCELLWVSKQTNPTHFGNRFFDVAASELLSTGIINTNVDVFLPDAICEINQNTVPEFQESQQNSALEWIYTNDENISKQQQQQNNGSALGPSWLKNTNTVSNESTFTQQEEKKTASMVRETGVTVHAISQPVQCKDDSNTTFTYVWLTNGKVYAVDLVISAIGVTPNLNFVSQNEHFAQQYIDSKDGGLIVNAKDLCVAPNIYAVGDCASITSNSQHWFQMRLWNQARGQGRHAAMVMSDTADVSYFGGGGNDFEIFAHHTMFFGIPICLLGRFNQVCIEDVEVTDKSNDDADSTKDVDGVNILVLVRRSFESYVKIILENDRVVGAVLMGKDEMENAETFENLILNRTDVKGIDLLNSQVDLADFFD